ncbi:alpha/beta fold hydrolase [Paracoccus binzhouensis]|uniref:alpha/beta fold hydrolase n=1 Tax=Paracoccus binzhouensis TaxID=2796149 RepID=UPI0018EF159B|nr:alpha/beta hydrolase [Paracoccus binzhouensis]
MAFQAKTSGPVAYLERPGAGMPLVALHGIGSNATGFAGLLPHLPEAWRVIAWDAPGYGASQPLAAEWPVAADYAAALAGLLDRLGVGRAVLLGHSLGTLMAAAFARRHPERVAALVLASCALGHGVSPGAALSEGAKARIDELQALGPAAFAAKRAPRLVHDADAHPELVAQVAGNMAQVRMPGYGQAARMLASGRLLEDLAALAVPASVIVGVGDLVTPPAANRRAHQAIPARIRGPLIELPGAGHAIHQQDPAAFARALATCLDQTPPAAAPAQAASQGMTG